MAKRVAADTDEQIIRHSANVPEEVSIDVLLRLLGSDISRRTLQRRLSELADAKRLTKEGRGTLNPLSPTTHRSSRIERGGLRSAVPVGRGRTTVGATTPD